MRGKGKKIGRKRGRGKKRGRKRGRKKERAKEREKASIHQGIDLYEQILNYNYEP